MRRLFPLLGALVALLAPRAGDAAVASLYARAHGGYAGTSSRQLVPGGSAPSLGPALGLEGGARLSILEGYVERLEFDRGGDVTRAVLGLRGTLDFAGLRLSIRGGAGVLREHDGALSSEVGRASPRDGVLIRIGASLDKALASWLFLGVGLDGEYHVIVPAAGVDKPADVEAGAAVFGSARLTFELGL